MEQTKTNLILQDWVWDFVPGRAREQQSKIMLTGSPRAVFQSPSSERTAARVHMLLFIASERVINQVIDKYRSATGRYFFIQEHKTCMLHFKFSLKSQSGKKRMS